MLKLKYITKFVSCLLVITLLVQCYPLHTYAEPVSVNSADRTTDIGCDYIPVEKSELQIAQENLDALMMDLFSAAENSDKDAIINSIGDLRIIVDQIKEIAFAQVADDEKDASNIMSENVRNNFENYKQVISQGFDNVNSKADELEKLCIHGAFPEIISLLNNLKEMLAPEIHNPLGADLPNSRMDIEPVFAEVSNRDTAGTDTSTQFGVIKPFSVSVADTPSDTDLAVIAETNISEEIKDLVKNMNVAEVYEYVCNNIDYEPYYGSRKGAIATFDQRSGNDLDIASLLIGVLRYKGIPARYKTGTVELTIDQAMKLTGTKDAMAAARAMSSLGVPTKAWTSQGKVSAIQVERVWAEAYIAYENYRGIGEGSGQKCWIPLDAGYKQYEIIESLDISPVMGVDQDEWEDFLNENVFTSDGGFLFDIESDFYGTTPEELTKNIENYIVANSLENNSFIDIAGGKKIVRQQTGLLPIVLPYKLIAELETFSSIPDKYKETVTVQIRNSMQFEATLSDLYNKRISISYIPATSEDAGIINSYGGIFKTPAYLINMKPQLKSDGIVLAEGASITLGKTQNVNLTFKTIGVTTDSTTHVLSAGGIYNISFNYGVISSSEMNSVADSLELLKHTANESNIYSDEVLGEILCAVGRGYYAKVDLCNALVAGQYGVRSNGLTSELMTGYKTNVQYLFSSPMRVNEGGMFIDAPRNINSVIDEESDRTNEIAFMLATGMLASAMEHEIFEDFTEVPSVSAMKILQVAGERHIPIYHITKANLNEVLPVLDISQAIKNDIRSAVNSGKVVAVPQRNVQYFDWNGVGYIVLDPTTGAAGYMINGGLAGGSMTWGEALEEYLIYVAAGLVLMPVFIAMTTVFVYAFPVAGPIIIKVVGALLLANWAFNIGKLIGTSITTQNPDYLYEALIQIAATTTLWGLSSTVLEGPVAKFQQNIIIQSLRADGWSQEAAISLYQLCGGDMSRISQLSARLVKLGLDNPGLTFMALNFDYGTILTIENTFARIALGRLSSGDVDIIFGLFKTVGTPTAANALSDSLVSMTNNWGILPSQFRSLGIHSSPGLIAANNALTAGITSSQMYTLADFGVNVADYSGYGIINWSTAQAAESAMSNIKSFGAKDQMQIARVGANAATAMANGCLFTEPSLPPGGKPDTSLTGYATPDPKDPDPIRLQNETADLFADKGYAVVLLPEDYRNPYGVQSGRYPDYLIEGKAFDCYTPEANTNPRNIWSAVKDKTEAQAERIIINLDRNTTTIDELLDQFHTWDTDLPTLKELFLVKGKELCRILIK